MSEKQRVADLEADISALEKQLRFSQMKIAELVRQISLFALNFSKEVFRFRAQRTAKKIHPPSKFHEKISIETRCSFLRVRPKMKID